MKKLWLRLGAVVEITDDEEKAIFGNDDTKMRDVLRLVIAEGRFCPDGEAYVPCEAVREFNKSYGAAYEEEDWFCDL